MTATPARPSRPFDLQFLTIAICATVLFGFWFTYFGPMLGGNYDQVSPLVHLHGWTFFGWYLLLPFQAGLIRVRRLPLHRTLGFASLALATLMFVTGLLVLGVQMRDALAATEPSFWSEAGPGILATLLLFAGFYAAAIVLRRKSPWHKRLIVVASAGGMGAAMFRILLVTAGPQPWITPTSFLATNIFIVAGMVIDQLRDGRIHPAYKIGLPVCVVLETGFYLATPTLVGQVISRGLAWIGTTFGFLY